LENRKKNRGYDGLYRGGIKEVGPEGRESAKGGREYDKGVEKRAGERGRRRPSGRGGGEEKNWRRRIGLGLSQIGK
jgi:hypothetical protein